MAAINDLINQIDDLKLRERIKTEVDKLSKQKKFGLVFENHVPECTTLYDVPVHVGSKVALKDKKINDVYVVKAINNNQAICVNTQTKDTTEFTVDSLVSIAEFGEAIYPYLKPVDSIENAPDNSLWHTLIEADNYHALQLLEYLYAGKVDCIYIDPPYNTGAKDWKYNNDYVDSSDVYRHSKWLSMMEKRLRLAKKLLNPADSVLIVTIDEKEYLHLGCLLEELFPDANTQMISSLIAQKGVARENSFYRTNEYIFFVQLGISSVDKLDLSDEWRLGKSTQKPEAIIWSHLRRAGTNDLRSDRPTLFYPIIFDLKGEKILGVGDFLDGSKHPTSSLEISDDKLFLWPFKSNGQEGRWQISSTEFLNKLSIGMIKVGRQTNETIPVYYLKRASANKVIHKEVIVTGYEKINGTVLTDDSSYKHIFVPGSQWDIASHDASTHGSQLLNKIFPKKRFSFPKSLYAVHDAIRFFVANKPNALILDFFAGSGTTLHAVNLLNAEDGGHRRCIMVTNNEVSDEEAKKLKKDGFKPGDPEWERLGIAHYVTWPRTVCSIKGEDINGNPLKGTYLDSERAMADGFKANAAFFKLGFLDKNAVALGRQFKELLPVLWMKTGCVGLCPKLEEESLHSMLILPQNAFAVLIDEHAFPEFMAKVNDEDRIKQVFIVTDSTSGYREMISHLSIKKSYQLYRDYLDNFRINTGR